MRRALISATILLASGLAAVPAVAEDAAKPTPPGAPATAGGENNKADESLSNPRQSGRVEPSATNSAGAHQASDGNAAPAPGPALVNGKLDVPGAPADGPTVPAKFSERNDKLDHTPTMAMPLGLTDEQRRKIVESVKSANQPEQASNAKPADELAWNVEVHDLGASAADPALKNLKYVRTKDRILLIDAPQRIVVGEVAAD